MQKLKLIIILLVNILVLDIQLRCGKFKNIIGSYCKKYEQLDMYVYTNYPEERKKKIYNELDQIILLIETASEIYPFNAKCLHRTLIGYKFLRKKYHLPVKFVIGVKKFPFDSHAWLKWRDDFGGENIFELKEDTDRYEIILDSSKYKNEVSI